MFKKLILFSLFLSFNGFSQKLDKKFIEEEFAFAKDQYLYMASLTPADRMPQSFDAAKNEFISREITWWCTGFYPGILWYIFEQTGDAAIKKEAERSLEVIKPNQTFTGNHDLGFMMYCSFGNAYRLTGKEEYREIINKSSESLSTRYKPQIKAIQSWNKGPYFNAPSIIDNMMNLEMLVWSTDNGGDAKFKEIAVNHANTTMKTHFRKDYSSWHLVDNDLETAKILRKATWQGAADCSSWARGQGWALYGYVMMHRMTGDKKYLKLAKNIAHFLIDHPNMPKDKVPYWDFDAPLIPRAKRDASAGSLIASALLELGRYTSGADKAKFVTHAEQTLHSLAGEGYRAKKGENGGFLLLHSVGALPLNSEVDVPLIYADYYYLEALKRYKDWYL